MMRTYPIRKPDGTIMKAIKITDDMVAPEGYNLRLEMHMVAYTGPPNCELVSDFGPLCIAGETKEDIAYLAGILMENLCETACDIKDENSEFEGSFEL